MSDVHVTNDQAEPCRSCGTALAHDQRYCLNCGARRAEQRVPVGPVLTALAAAAALAARDGSFPPVADPAVSPIASAAGASGVAGLAASFANKPAASAGLALLMVGAIIGSAFGPPLSNTMAAGRRVVIVQAAGAPATGPAAAPETVVETPTDSSVAPEPIIPAIPPPPAPAPTPTTPTTPNTPTNPSVGHVFLVLLPGGGSGQTLAGASGYGAHASSIGIKSAADGDYLKTILAHQGTLLENFRQVSKSAVANRIALLSGQPPNADTEAGCTTVTKVPDVGDSYVEGTPVSGSGCIYPAAVKTVADRVLQTDVEGVRVYKESGSAAPPGALCEIPAVGSSPSPPAGWLPPAFDDPMVWFESVTGGAGDQRSGSYCPNSDGGNFVNHPLSDLKSDLAASAAAPTEKPFPALTIIVPSRCRGQVSVQCPDGGHGGPAALDAFLKDQISGTLMSSKVFKTDGMSVVAWDQPPTTTSRRARGAAGSTIAPSGALVLSPFAKAGTVVSKAYDTWDLLLTIQDRLGIYSREQQINPLGKSNDPGTLTFGSDVFKKKLDPRPTPSF